VKLWLSPRGTSALKRMWPRASLTMSQLAARSAWTSSVGGGVVDVRAAGGEVVALVLDAAGEVVLGAAEVADADVEGDDDGDGCGRGESPAVGLPLPSLPSSSSGSTTASTTTTMTVPTIASQRPRAGRGSVDRR
jgi:hypothetical protein